MTHFNEVELEDQLRNHLIYQLADCNLILEREKRGLSLPKLTEVNRIRMEQTIESITKIADFYRFELSLRSKPSISIDSMLEQLN
jgi:hypothetical protein